MEMSSSVLALVKSKQEVKSSYQVEVQLPQMAMLFLHSQAALRSNLEK